jgi:hypothetical protein
LAVRGLEVSDEIDTHDLTTEKRRLLAETRADLLKRQLSNAENYDKAVLSLSTAFLGFSLAFLKDLVPIHLAEWRCFLYGSWMALGGSVLCTIVSFWVSQRAIDVQLRKAEDYYLRDDQSALRKSPMAKATDWVNAASGVLFVLGLLLTTTFVGLNFERSLKMSDEQKGQRVPLKEGAPIPTMQEVPLEKGAPIPRLQQVPQSQPENQQPAQDPPAVPSGSDAPSDQSK